MRILARTQGLRYSWVAAVVLALAILSVIGQRPMLRGISGAIGAGQSMFGGMHAAVEPAVFMGGLVVSRNRHVIAGAVMGCGVGAAIGAGVVAALALATGGISLAAVPPAAGVGCLVGGASGIATAYPLDSWALKME